MSAQLKDVLKRLQHMQRLIERACAERDLAYAEAARWKQRYETEAHQRQLERSQSDEILQQRGTETQAASKCNGVLEQESLNQKDSEPLEKIVTSPREIAVLMRERKQLRLELEQEKENHQKTRASLITALGDALQRK